MGIIIKYLGAGNLNKYPDKAAVVIVITKFSDINNIVIPLFKENPLLGIKLLDYLDWCKIAILMSEKSHLTPKGLSIIRQIKSGMNKNRDIFNT
jgi:hypothetical protein